MKGTEFFKRYTPHESSYLYEDMIDSTEHVYMNVVPRQTGTTTSLIVYSVYKIMENKNKYNIAYVLSNKEFVKHMFYEFDSYLDYFCIEYNKEHSHEMTYEIHNNNKYVLLLDSNEIGYINLCKVSDSLYGYKFNERIYENPTMTNVDVHQLMDEIYSLKEPSKIIHNSNMIHVKNVDLSIYNPKYTPCFQFWHIDLFQYQQRMLNILGKELYTKDCLLKGICYARI
ncbi:hypothetical protein CPT_Muenster_348 [Klebsiella phage Muenster]|nr:hypothetical protein CPT_Muenster_348 [Klebsiella phage Muenster]